MISGLRGWSRHEKQDVATIIRAQAGPNEMRYLRLTQKHARLRAERAAIGVEGIVRVKRVPMSHPILLYDGVCGLCNRLVQFILRRDPSGMFRFASLQSTLAAGILARHGE